jgi:hypothetical protein
MAETPILAGQVWQDRDRRSSVKVRVVRVDDTRVYYQRGGFPRTAGPEHHTCSTKLAHFPRRFRYITDPSAPSSGSVDNG